MRATEIIRSVLDLIDHIEIEQEPVAIADETEISQHGDDENRFKQICDLLSNEYTQMYNNSPAEVVAGIESVTTDAGGGWMGPKNPADMRSDSVSMYPSYLHKPGE
jgi:hypothetical protein